MTNNNSFFTNDDKLKILIITSCTGAKKYKPTNQLIQSDFEQIGTDAFSEREKELKDFRVPAVDMYTGQQHIRLMQGLDFIRESCSDVQIDLKIVSAGYGFLDESTPIVPYEVTFSGMRVKALRQWADFLQVPKKTLIAIEGYDLTIFLLGKEYLKAVGFPKTIETKGALVFLTSKGSQACLPAGPNVINIFLENKEAKQMGAGLVALKGRAVEILGEKVVNDPSFLRTIVQSPDRLVEFFREYKRPLAPKSGLKAPKAPNPKKRINTDPEVDPKNDYDSRVISLSKEWLNKPHRKKMRYFIPEWDDLVNPAYDFETDTPPPGTGDGYDFAHYAHQIYDYPNYDGILISKIIVEGKKSKKAILEKLGVHKYLRVPRTFPIMGDCGAFGYIMEEVPPFETPEILDYYQRFDFDYGVSIDHLIVNAVLKRDLYFMVGKDGNKQGISKEEYENLKESGKAKEIQSIRRQLKLFDEGPFLLKEEVLDEKERARRYDLTIRNARDFINGHKDGQYRFTPIGAVQGWSPESYADAVKEYQDMGYTYIALGGLVRTPSKGILAVLEEVNKILRSDVDLHLFGVARPDALPEMNRLGVTSIDSASFLRRAWLGASANYFTEGDNYAAIRIPQAEKSPRAKKIVREGKISLDNVKRLEEKCLKLMRAFDKDQVGIEEVFEAVMTYDDLMGGNRNGHDKLIRKTLEDRPWKRCNCKICREKGVEVIIFRGNNRNRRRGFHNTKIFYDRLCQMFGNK